MKRAFISVTNDLVTDQRVGRVAALLVRYGFRVTCIGRKNRYSLPVKSSQWMVKRFRMVFQKGPLFYACYNTRLFFLLILTRRPFLFISNDLDTLPASFLASRIRGAKLIYDSHEFFTQVPELVHRKRIQAFWRWIESRIVPRIKYAVTVSYSIAEIYRRLYGTRFTVVRNTPAYRTSPPLPANRKDKRPVILYQGVLNLGRGLELMIAAMEYLENTDFVIAGTGDIENKLRKMVEERGLSDKVIFKGRIPPDELSALTCAADIGISLEEDLGLNYRYALPNKLFDYIQCRVPVLCAALPEMSRIVETYGIGIVARKREPEQLARNIRYMLRERGSGAWREALDKAAAELNWERESQNYLNVLEACGAIGKAERKIQ